MRVFGSLDLEVEGGDAALILRQPKSAAVLVYLATALPRGFHRRDALLALFWPEMDAAHARDALNSSLKLLRQGLGPDASPSRGDEEVAVAADCVWTDAVAFEAAIDDGECERALALSRGDFLEGFHVAEALGFEEWMETERGRLRSAAAEAARALAEQVAVAGDFARAAQWARRALALAPDDEITLRRLLELLHLAGDRAAALRAYDEFASRLKAEFGVEPTRPTRLLVEEIRQSTPIGDGAKPKRAG